MAHKGIRFELKRSFLYGNWWFTVKAANHQIIVTSEMYTSRRAALNGIRVVRKAFDAPVVDMTKEATEPTSKCKQLQMDL